MAFCSSHIAVLTVLFRRLASCTRPWAAFYNRVAVPGRCDDQDDFHHVELSAYLLNNRMTPVNQATLNALMMSTGTQANN